MPFPTEFPQAALTTILANITGKQETPLHDLIEAGYDVLGYGLDVSLPGEGDPPLALKMTRHTEPKEHAAVVKVAAAAQPRAIDWGSLIPVLISLITQWIGGQR